MNMPTGYTYPVAEGTVTTLRQFALLCSRAMGAMIMMRDDSLDAPIPERFEPSTNYYDERLTEARAILAELPTLSDEECERRALEEYETALAAHREYEARREQENQRLRDMLAAVQAWETKAEGIKDFMLQQLGISASDYRSPEPLRQSGKQWRETTLNRAAESADSSEAERAKEIVRTEDRNRWLADLRASLPLEETR